LSSSTSYRLAMSRRRFLVTSLAAGLAVPLAAGAQPGAKIWRIGYLTPVGIPRASLIEALRDLGYIEGQAIRLEVRSADNNLDRLPGLAVALEQGKVDIIVAVSPPAIRAASQATKTIPIVMAFWGGEGLIESGIVTSFARSGTNVTGIYMFAAELDAKRLALLLEAMPNARRIGLLNPGLGWGDFAQVRGVAQRAKVQLRMIDIPGSNSYERAFATMATERVDALLVPSFPRFYQDQQQIVELARRRRIPAMYEWGDMARAGGLMGYGPVLVDLNRSVAIYVDKILKGVKPSDLPIEQPTKFELVINLKTAKAIGLTIPPSLLARADQVID
jgi:putative tryptophan/tyrosine transport system substrate-binding protein